MKTMSTSHAEPGDAAAPQHGAGARRVLIWDAPVRVFHWLMVLCFAGAWLTAESERWRLLHVTLGYTMAGLLVFRLVWGLVGTRHARFASFVRAPGAAWRYLKSLAGPKPEHHVGHNPAGALAIVGLLVLTALVAATGTATYQELGGDWAEELHEGAANAMMALVVLHVVGVIVGSWRHRESLVGAMLSGRKTGRADDAVHHARRGVAALMIAAVLGFWWLQWRDAPGTADRGMASGADATAALSGDRHGPSDGRRDRDDD